MLCSNDSITQLRHACRKHHLASKRLHRAPARYMHTAIQTHMHTCMHKHKEINSARGKHLRLHIRCKPMQTLNACYRSSRTAFTHSLRRSSWLRRGAIHCRLFSFQSHRERGQQQEPHHISVHHCGYSAVAVDTKIKKEIRGSSS